LATARKLFGEAGYHATGTTEIVARSRLTRGALYHHFAGKEGLFEAVFRQVASELVNRSNTAVAGLSGDLWPQVQEAFRQYLLLIATTKEYRRILLIDGPAVLGWVRWRELQSEFVAKGAAEALQLLMDRGLVQQQPAMPLACMIQATLQDAALTIANAPADSNAAEEAMAAFLFVLNGIKRSPA
jgi:AcrR family transcriptional regulator